MRSAKWPIALALISAALTLAAFGCGGDGDENQGTGAKARDPEAWSADVCGALVDWRTDLQQRQKNLERAINDA
jgi:hypothetical protein